MVKLARKPKVMCPSCQRMYSLRLDGRVQVHYVRSDSSGRGFYREVDGGLIDEWLVCHGSNTKSMQGALL